MSFFRVKVCGVTRPEDALLAQKLGVDLIGLIFATDSPRKVTRRTARIVCAELTPFCQPVGVFRDQSVDTVLAIADQLRLPLVQLHGSFSAAMIRRIQQHGRAVIVSLDPRMVRSGLPAGSNAADLLLFDNGTGGSGHQFDWSRRLPATMRPYGIAGGVHATNVAEGVRRFSPDFVDVNSGVESSPGCKSAAKLKQFMKRCNEIRYART